jgi:hypothetical protein
MNAVARRDRAFNSSLPDIAIGAMPRSTRRLLLAPFVVGVDLANRSIPVIWLGWHRPL